MNDIDYMKVALREANKAFKKNEIPIGCVIVKNDKIIARSHNMKEIKVSCTKHAEIIAIEKASKSVNNWRLLDTTIYVTMLPCPMCASAINQARISRLVYGTMPEYADVELINRILNDNKYGNPVEIIGNVLELECKELLQKFFSKKR